MIRKTSERIPANSVMVLLVDDQVIVGEAVRRLLAAEADIDLHYCADALEAINEAHQIKPTVILLDLVMPGIDGIELVRRFRQAPTTSDTPIVVLSSKEDPRVKGQAFAAGANDYLVKLPDSIELIARIRYHSAAYLNRLQRDEAFQALHESQEQLLAVERSLREVEMQQARREAEEALMHQAEELARSNADLEQFAYLSSHDLQEPLRMVTNYVELLKLQYNDLLDAEGKEYIAYAIEGVVRMQALVNGLRAYNCIGNQGKAMKPTDCKMVLAHALADLNLAITESAMVVTDDSLPIVVADTAQLVMLFENLIDNAIKFCDEKPPRVHFSARYTDMEWEFSVRDNGIGIAPKHTKRIFNIFQRLHSRTKYPGTGIGLAVCKRIVERHGGRIWVETNAENGSTFLFTIRSNSYS